VRKTAIALTSVLLLSGVAACARERKPIPVPQVVSSPVISEKLTPQSAAETFKGYAASEDVARASGDERLALTWTSDGQSELTAAEFRKAAFTGTAVTRYDYGTPTFYVPDLNSYPQWFVAAADRTAAGQAGTKQTALLAFIRNGPADRWKLSLATLLAKGSKLPSVVVDASGYATPLATFAAAPLIQPRSVPSIQASIAEDGPQAAATKVMKDGPYTTGFNAQKVANKAADRKIGLAVEPIFQPTLFPIFPLKTADGGGLVLYALKRQTVTFVALPGHTMPIPRDAVHMLDTLVMKDQLTVNQTMQFAAAVPPTAKPKATQPKADVIAADYAVTSASTQSAG
jgi:hypothetical protein